MVSILQVTHCKIGPPVFSSNYVIEGLSTHTRKVAVLKKQEACSENDFIASGAGAFDYNYLPETWGGILPYISYTGMCYWRGYSFQAI